MTCVLGKKCSALVGKALDIAGSAFLYIRDGYLLCVVSKQCILMGAFKQKVGKDLHH